jgi:hypothetical protein
MQKSLVHSKRGPVPIPAELMVLFGDPPLVGNEKRLEYEQLFVALVEALKPVDTLVWIFIRDVTDITWEIRRERKIKAEIVNLLETEVMIELLNSMEKKIRPIGYERTVRAWTTNASEKAKVEKKLASYGYDRNYILAQAYIRGANNIGSIDQRLAGYEMRRALILRSAEIRNDSVLRKIEQISFEVGQALLVGSEV